MVRGQTSLRAAASSRPRRVTLQPHHQGFAFRIAKAHVEFEHPEAIPIDHQANEQHPPKRHAAIRHHREGRLHDLAHDPVLQCGIELGNGRVGAHPAGVRTAVAVEHRLMILRHPQRHRVAPVAQGKERNFLPGKLILDHHPFSGRAKNAPLHRVVHCMKRAALIVAYRHAFARGQAVGLDHYRSTAAADIGARLLDIVEHGRGGGQNPRLLHDLLGERLAGFQLGRGPRRSEQVEPARRRELVTRFPEVKGLLQGRNHGQIGPFPARQSRQAVA